MRGLVCGVLMMLAFQVLIPYRHAAAQTHEDAAYDQSAEITIERVHDGCLNCPDHKIVLRRESGRKYGDATVTRTDLHSKKEVQGMLRAYYFNNLLKLIESQGYFGMKDEYAMGWVDSTIVTLSVAIGDRRKVIRTRSEGHVPIQLWGIFYAIDGAVANMNWGSNR